MNIKCTVRKEIPSSNIIMLPTRLEYWAKKIN